MNRISPNEEAPPRVDVLMPVYNGATYLAEQIDSILGQQGVDIRLIVVNDASSDESLRILEGYADSDERVTVFSNPQNLGLIRTIGLLLARVDAPYFALSDQDDVWDEDKMATSIGSLVAWGAALVSSDVRVIDAVGRVTSESYIASRGIRVIEGTNPLPFVFQNPAIGHTLVGLAEVARSASDIPATLVFHEAWIVAVATKLGQVRCIPKPLGSYRFHESNVVGPASARGTVARAKRLVSPGRIEGRYRTRSSALAAVSRAHPRYAKLAAAYSKPHWNLLRILRVVASILRIVPSIGLASAGGEIAAWSMWQARRGAGNRGVNEGSTDA
jgi:glycosyltransferase involved in cell wall biosynthesis